MRAFVLGALMSGVACSAAHAQNAFCDDLWSARNTIYKSAGYCFKTSRAIQAFGNAGCQYDDARSLPLSDDDRRQVDLIARRERQMGCR